VIDENEMMLELVPVRVVVSEIGAAVELVFAR